MERLSKKRYFEIKNMGESILKNIGNPNSTIENRDKYIREYGKLLNNDEERLLLDSMILFPMSKTEFIKYYRDKGKDVRKIANDLNTHPSRIFNKVAAISMYECYEDEVNNNDNNVFDLVTNKEQEKNDELERQYLMIKSMIRKRDFYNTLNKKIGNRVKTR